jgi:hypothetical protein
MAEVQFFGIGAAGFPDPSSQLVPGQQRSQAEVQLLGLDAGPSPTGALNTKRELLSPSQIARAEFTAVELVSNPDRPSPQSTNPNENDLVFVVTGAFGSLTDFSVRLTPAIVPTADNNPPQGPILPDAPVYDSLQLFIGPNAPSGLIGGIIMFGQATGTNQYSAIAGATGLITGVGADSLNSTPITVSGLTIAPTNGDRFTIDTANRALRRTPVIEIILAP